MADATDPFPDGTAEAQGSERRAHVRYSSDLETFCQPGAGQLESFWWMTKVRDISGTGLALVVPRRFDPGTLLTVELQSMCQNLSRTLQVRVVHAKLHANGGWILGCAFVDELADNELKDLL